MNNQEKKTIIFLGAIIRLPAATQIIEMLKNESQKIMEWFTQNLKKWNGQILNINSVQNILW